MYEVKSELFSAYGRDISEGGLRIEFSTAFKPTSILKITFKVGSHDENESEAYVRVVWTHQNKHGLHFLMLEDSARRKIRDFLGNADGVK